MYKGQMSPTVLAVVILLGLLTVSLLGYLFYLSVRAPAVVPKEYEGEFDKFYAPEEVGGTDLTITEWTVNETGVVPDANVKFAYDLNGTDGQIHYAAFAVEIDGDMEDIDIDADLSSTVSASEIKFHRAYILEDKEGVIMDPSDAKWTLSVDPDGDKVEGKIGPVPDGKYVVVFELKAIDTDGIASDENIFTVKMDATTEGDNDYLEVTIDNA